jgi:hypothetical protein
MKKSSVKILLGAAAVAAALSGGAVYVTAAVRAPVAAAPAPVVKPLPVSLVSKPAPLISKLGAASLPPVTKSLGVKSSGEIAMAVPGLAVRPPFRPPPRSAYRPPARPPFAH